MRMCEQLNTHPISVVTGNFDQSCNNGDKISTTKTGRCSRIIKNTNSTRYKGPVGHVTGVTGRFVSPKGNRGIHFRKSDKIYERFFDIRGKASNMFSLLNILQSWKEYLIISFFSH